MSGVSRETPSRIAHTERLTVPHHCSHRNANTAGREQQNHNYSPSDTGRSAGQPARRGFCTIRVRHETREHTRELAIKTKDARPCADASCYTRQASIAADSHLRVYECLDPSPAGLASWSLLEDIDLLALPDGYYSSAAANHPQSTHHHQAQTQLIKGFDDSSRALGAAGGSSGSLGAQSGSSNSDGNTAGRPNGAVGRIESTGAWALAYCQEAWWGEVAAVSAGKDGSIRVSQGCGRAFCRSARLESHARSGPVWRHRSSISRRHRTGPSSLSSRHPLCTHRRLQPSHGRRPAADLTI